MLKTCLYDFHVANGAKMVDFAGWLMPVLYNGQSHIQSHNWVRQNAGLFDVSHMVQHKFTGPDSTKLLERITPSDLKALKPFHSTLSVLLNENGGIVDDTVISKHGEDDFYVVTNAGTRDKDLSFFKDQASKHGFSDFQHDLIGGGLLALQGPKAAEILQSLTAFNLKDIAFGQSAFVDLLGAKLHVARGGYTGEDGFEISIPEDSLAVELAETLLGEDAVKPIGLAARDSLRLEAGMCLYGHDLNDNITPVEGRLAWTVAKSRRSGEFNGVGRILDQLKEKNTPIRTGLVSTGPAPREGCEVVDADGNQVGTITSGSLSPTLGKNVAMAYLPRNLAKKGTELAVVIRGKARPAVVESMPFIKTNYYKP